MQVPDYQVMKILGILVMSVFQPSRLTKVKSSNILSQVLVCVWVVFGLSLVCVFDSAVKIDQNDGKTSKQSRLSLSSWIHSCTYICWRHKHQKHQKHPSLHGHVGTNIKKVGSLGPVGCYYCAMTGLDDILIYRVVMSPHLSHNMYIW